MSVKEFFEQYSEAQEVHEVDGLLFLASAKADADAYARNRQSEVVTFTREDHAAMMEKLQAKREKATAKKAKEVDTSAEPQGEVVVTTPEQVAKS